MFAKFYYTVQYFHTFYRKFVPQLMSVLTSRKEFSSAQNAPKLFVAKILLGEFAAFLSSIAALGTGRAVS